MMMSVVAFFFMTTPSTRTYTLSLHDALPISGRRAGPDSRARLAAAAGGAAAVLLEERQVGARRGAAAKRSPRLLGTERLPQSRRSVEGGTLLLSLGVAQGCPAARGTTDPSSPGANS